MTDEYVRKTIKLEKEVWDSFQEKIEAEYGTTYKHTSTEMKKAIENYVSSNVQDIEETKTKISILNDENILLKDKVKKLEKSNDNLNDELLRSRSGAKKDQNIIDDLKDRLSEVEEDNIRLESEVKSLKKDLERLNKDNEVLIKRNDDLVVENKNLEEKYIAQVDETNKQVLENTKIKNKREHAQERLNKTQDELNDTLKRLEKYSFAIGQVQNMSFIDRLFNRLPEQVRELQPGKKDEV